MPSPQQLACAAFVAGIVLPMYVLFFVALADVVNGLLQTACLAVAVALVRPAWRQEHGAVCALTSASALRPEGRNSAVKPSHPLCSWDAVPPHVDAAVSGTPVAPSGSTDKLSRRQRARLAKPDALPRTPPAPPTPTPTESDRESPPPKVCSKALRPEERFDLLNAILSGRDAKEAAAAYAFSKFEADYAMLSEYERLMSGQPSLAEMNCSTCCGSDSSLATSMASEELESASEAAAA